MRAWCYETSREFSKPYNQTLQPNINQTRIGCSPINVDMIWSPRERSLECDEQGHATGVLEGQHVGKPRCFPQVNLYIGNPGFYLQLSNYELFFFCCLFSDGPSIPVEQKKMVPWQPWHGADDREFFDGQEIS